MRLIHQYFTLQLIQISAFANVLPRQNFPMYGSTLKELTIIIIQQQLIIHEVKPYIKGK